MAVKLRLKRFGRRHRPFYRLNAMDTRSARDSKAIEELGYYDPLETQQDKALQLKQERIEYWLSVGAQPSETVRSLLKKAGIDPTPGQKIENTKVKNDPTATPKKVKPDSGVGSAAGWSA